MPNRRPVRSHWKFFNSRKAQAERVKRRSQRRPLLEALEQRQLLAVGPQLAGIQPDEGALLRNGDVLNVSPRELKFQFNDGAVIDESTLTGIRLTRSNDTNFATATATSDFNTNGQLVIDFRAVSPGTSGNDIRIEVIKNAAPTGPLVSVVGGVIEVELNTTTGTTANQLVSAINGHPQAGQLVSASIRRGSGATNISQPAITYSPIVTSGANAASAVTNLGVGTSLQMKLTATQPGSAGENIAVLISRRDFGGVSPPRVTVSGREVSVEVNSNPASPTTAGELVSAINGNAAARALVTASLPIGNPSTLIGNRTPDLRLSLVGVADIPIVPGFIGLGDSPREVVMRFSEPLSDAFYHVEIIGMGSMALRDVDGVAFGDTTDDTVDDGSNFGLGFQLDLGAQVVAVVPQPLTRNPVTNILTQARSQINVYFNDDDLFATRVVTNPNSTSNPRVVDPAFYQLIFTNETVENTDDVIYHPTRIDYDPLSDMAVLIFASDIEDLGSGAGTFRLRIGTEMRDFPVAPLRTVSSSDEGSSFDTAQAVGLELEVIGDGQTLTDSQTITLTGQVDAATQTPTTTTFEFVDTAAGGTVSGTNVAIPFDESLGQAAITAAIAAAINQSAVGRATVDGNRISLTGTLAAAPSAGMTTVRVQQLRSLVISSAIEAKPYDLDFPGGLDDHGHREIPEEAHVLFGADEHDGITTLSYNFRPEIGNDPAGRSLFNVITERQKQRAREIFHIYGELFGVQFIETDLDGLTIATGDMRAINPTVPTGPRDGVTFLSTSFQDPMSGNVTGLLILDNAENWDDGFGATDNPGRISWFEEALQGVGSLLGLGATTDLPPATTRSGGFLTSTLQFGNPIEHVYPGAADVVHGQYLYRPEGQDIDMFQVTVPETGLFSAEVIAERQHSSSLLDSVLMLFRDVPGGEPELIARNNDYYSNDSHFELKLAAGTYWVGVSASGNEQYDPVVEDSGFGGTTEGAYDLRLNFRPDANRELTDATGVALDGDGNGTPGGVYNFWFEAQDESRTVFVDKAPPAIPTGALGSIRNPHTLISTALADASFRSSNGQDVIVRIVGNGGTDRDLSTLTDNIPYELGFQQSGGQLADGASLVVPQGVTVMIDSGAVIKSRRGRLSVGSSSATIDRSESALQVLGTPVILNSAGTVVRDTDGNAVPGSVYFTSLNDDTIGAAGGIARPAPAAGDWGGLSFRADIDRADANRVDLEDRGIFLNYVSNADIRYGGGSVVVDGIPQTVSPIHMTDARVTATFNTISLSGDAAMSASPDTFQETNFHSPEYQFSPFTSEYQRVGPDIYGNRLVDNSINGLFVRVQTPAGGELRPLTVAGRFNDRDITHVIAENLVIQGTPGGPVQEGDRPVADFVTLEATTILAVIGSGSTVVDADTFTITPAATGVPVTFEFVDAATGRTTTGTRPVVFDTSMNSAELAEVVSNSISAAGVQTVLDVRNITLRGVVDVITASSAISLSGATLPAGVYNYKVVFVDADGNEGLASAETRDVTVTAPQNAVRLLNLPVPTGNFVSRRIYRSDDTGNANGVYTLVAELNASDTFFVDDGSTFGGTLRPNTSNLRARLDGRLAIDPGIVVKMDGATIEARFGAQLIAEGLVGQEVVFTSINDDTYGGGGTFDASNNGFQEALPGDWGGLYLGHMARGSLDHALISYGGGVARVEGNFTGFNAVEIQQSDVRIAHSAFRNNADGTGGQASPNRAGRGENNSSLIFVRGAQPVILDNMMLNNEGPVISIDANSLESSFQTDVGRTTYHRGGRGDAARIDREPGFADNNGPLVRLNALGDNDINGMQIRGATLTTQGVWDDTDIVHVLLDQTVYVPDFHTFGGLRLESSASQSLVVKLQGENAGFTATGRPLDIIDRIGGSLQIVGQPSHPVVITSLADDSVGAGTNPNGDSQTATGKIQRGTSSTGALRLVEPVPGFGATFVGNVGVSTDGLGTVDVGNLVAAIPDGATVERALLHVATRSFGAPFQPPMIGFEGQNVSLTYLPNVSDAQGVDFETGTADVTAIVAASVGTQSGLINFAVDETVTGSAVNVEGTSLTVIYSHPDLPLQSILVLEGGLTGPTPQLTGLDFANPIDTTDPAFVAQLALGIQFGVLTQNQFSTVDINQQRLTSSAGHFDDSAVMPASNGSVITVGGVGDSPANPVNPFATDDLTDDELYDLSPFLASGTTQFMMETANPSDDDSIFLAVLLLSGDARLGGPQEGDWRSIEIEEFANDRNVDIVTEREPAELAAPGNNFSPDNAQFLGGLAPHEKAGDESLRLGFEVHGVIAERGDYDVYSFDARAGTEVWFDIDRTSHTLDSVIELIDANGNVHQGAVLADPSRTVLARSDNSIEEALLPAEEASLTVRPLQKSAFNEPDRYTTNPKDAGMRVVLPGPSNTTNTYYLRVRSSSPALSVLAGGKTKGAYQLQIRLREQDEVPGTTVKYSDIRFATNGIEISGQPTHSPLSGEATETLDAAGVDTNDNFASPEVLGNVLNTDRGALGIAGELGLPTDVDWFQFDVEYDSIQGQGVAIPRHASLILDIDYADGFARPNTNIWVFNDAGALVAIGGDSNIADDRPAALHGVDVDDLSRGSAGALDPYIGPLEFPANGAESGRYFVAVTSNAVIPAGMDQFLTPLPSDPLLRLEPSNSVPRIAEDHVNGTNLSNIAQSPQVPVLFDDGSVDPFRLSDVGLFVIQDSGADQSRVVMVDAFTGARENTVGVFQANVDDVALHPVQGLLFGFNAQEQGNPTDANTGNYHQIDPRSTNTTNLSINLGDDGIETFNQDPMNAMPAAIRSNNNNGVGVRFDAIAIGDDGPGPLSGYAIGSRAPGLNVQDTRNLLYEFNPNTGAAFSAPRPDRAGNTGPNTLTQGAWTNIVEHAALNTAFDPNPGSGNPQAVAPEEATTIDAAGLTVSIIHDGESSLGTGPATFTVSDGVQTLTFEFNAGPEVRVFHDPAAAVPITIRDGDTFRLDTTTYEFDTGSVLDLSGMTPATLNDGDSITITPSIGAPPAPQVFEFDTIGDGQRNIPGSNLIDTSQLGNAALIIAEIVDRINAIEMANPGSFNVTATTIGTRLSLTNENVTSPVVVNAGGIVVDPNTAPGVRAGTVAVPAEESMTAFELGAAIDAAIDGPGHDASSEGDRLNFSGAITGDFTQLEARGVFTNVGSTGNVSTAGAIPVNFLARDAAVDVATRMAQAINISFNANIATLAGESVQLANGFAFTQATQPPLTIGGVGPDGDISGLAWVGGRLFAVSGDDPFTARREGGLYEIVAPQSFFAVADYIETSTALSGITFTALAAGPANIENGRYADILFGIDTFGDLHAFDTNGVLQPVFADGQTSVATGVTGADGLAFSNLDFNLWHTTDARRADAGHGVEEVVDGSRAAELDAGNRSWYFGYESAQANGIPNRPETNPGNSFDYDFIGGAHGSLISNPFDLEGFSAEDLPTLYYNYYLDTENESAALNPTEFMRDSFRVYVSGDDGVWHLVSTNNSARGRNIIDEYDDPDLFDNINAEVQENFDVGDRNAPDSWRQARIPLGTFAGQSNLRLRFDFDTAGGRGPSTDGLLRQNTVGEEIRAIEAARLRDGQTFTLQTITDSGSIQLDVFELDFGHTLVAPGGAALDEGDSFTVDGTTYIFDDTTTTADPTADVADSVAVPFTRSDSALVVANSISQTILANPPAPLVTIGDLTEPSLDPTQPPVNDILSAAVDTTLRGITATFQATGAIGDNPTQPNAALDVDLVRLEMQVGDTLNVDLDADPGSPLFDGFLRVFDANGVEVASNSAGAGPGEMGNGLDPFLSYTATVTGTYYVGVSDESNPFYNPRSQTVASAAPNTIRREYQLDVSVVDPAGPLRQQTNRINLPNAETVTTSGTPTGFLEGGAGVSNGFPVRLHASMSAAEVANEIALALGSFYANGAPGIFQTRDGVITVIGHTVSSQSAGPLLGQALGVSEPLYGDLFGAFEASSNFDGSTDAFSPGALRLQDNAHEGLYLDDFIIGLAERGEMVSGATVSTNFVANTAQPDDEIDVGPYQLEIRRAEDFGISVIPPVPTLLLTQSFDSNSRFGEQTTITTVPGNLLWDGQTFNISDGLGVLTFEFDDDALDGALGNGRGNGVAPGNVALTFRASHTSNEVAELIRDTLNSSAVQSRLDITAALADGAVTGTLGTSSIVNLFGNAIVDIETVDTQRNVTADEPNDTINEAVDTGIGTSSVTNFIGTGVIGDNGDLTTPSADADLFTTDLLSGQTITIDVDASQVGSTLDPILIVFDSQGLIRAFDFGSLDSFIRFTAPSSGTYYIGVSGFANFNYDPSIAGSGDQFGGPFSTGEYTIRIATEFGLGLAVSQSNRYGDSNRERDQGQLIIESNIIRNSLEYGIIAGPGDRDISALAPLAGNLPHAGPVRVTREVNTDRLVPGVVIFNNVIAKNASGGIQFSGDPNPAGQQEASRAFGRIVNNTIVGRMVGTGIEVGPNASPTLLNNIVADFATGISVDPTSTSTVIGGTLYRGNSADTAGIGVGSFPVFVTDPNAPLFVDEMNDNYYLAPGARAIDSSVDSLPDRPGLTLIRGPLGISPSPILAPKEDALGQTRVDDPTVPSLPGQGSNVFKDRGAIDRADFAGPTAVLISPQDNDSLGRDSDPRTTFVNLTNRTLQNFAIQLLDGIEPNNPQNGTGASDTSVRSDRLTLFRDDVLLAEGVDYKFSYDTTNNIIRLTPLAGIWETDHRYDIVLSNARGFLITAPDGSQVVDGDSFNVADRFGNAVNFEFDSGYVLQVPQTLALQIPANAATLLTDRATITVTDSTTANTVVFEFDLDGFVTTGNQRIPFTRSSSANEIAQAIVTAMQTADIGLSPVNHVNFGGRAVHLGTRSTHAVDLSNSPLSATGQVAGIDDGQTFLIDDGTRRVTFEFTSTGSLTTGDRAIPFSFAQTNEQIAQSVAAAIGSAGLGLSPRYVALSDGLINVGGEVRHFLDASNSTLIQTGEPGVTPEFGLRIPTVAGQLDFTQIMDGDQFTITNGADAVTIELDDNGIVSSSTTDPLVVVDFTNSTTVNQLANAVAIAIRNASIGLSPANAGGGIINLLNATQQTTIDLTNSSFTQRGTAGVEASVAVPFDAGTSFAAGTATRVPIDSAEVVAAAITSAINGARTTDQLQSVFATQEGREINLEGVPGNGGVTGLGTLLTSEIVDVAGNALQANRPDGTSRFTITIASGLDYGDAPAPYPTLLADDGARHQASDDFVLGTLVDVDFDGQPSPGADGDDNASLNDEDGVQFPTLAGGSTVDLTIQVTASQAGFVDAWIDFNQDGDWNDAEEQVLVSRAVADGTNTESIMIPGTALPGNTFARFRLSSRGGLLPTGLAEDGEVEDYAVTIVGNPWHNTANPLDVDGSGFVVPLDVLLVINYINANGVGTLPPEPGPGDHRIDTNADGSITALDVLLIINALNSPGFQPEGESVVDVAPTPQGAANDPLTWLATDVVVDQRIDVYEQRETVPQVQQAIRQATRFRANDEVFGNVDAFASSIAEQANASRTPADELDDLTFEPTWASGVDDLFGDWV